MPTPTNRPRVIALVFLPAVILAILAIIAIIAIIAAVILALARWTGPAQHSAGLREERTQDGGMLTGVPPLPQLVDLPVAGITGTVRGPGGAALGGARVCAWALTPSWLTAEHAAPQCSDTGPDGSYALTNLPPLRHAIHASAPRHQPSRLGTDLSLQPGEHRDRVDLTLAPGGVRVTGVVQDLSGGVVEGAWVANGDGRGPATASARSDGAGRFTLWVSPGLVHLAGHADGYADASEHGSAPGEGYILLLTPESVLPGRVVMAGTRAAVAGARVTVIGDIGEAGPIGMGVALSDAAGEFRITRLQPGVYKPRVQAEGHHGEAERSVHLGLGETSDPLTIVVHAVPALSGRIAVNGGAGGCPRGDVFLSSRAGLQTLVEAVDDTGAVRFPALRPDTYDVRIDCPGYVVPTIFTPVTVAQTPVTGVVWQIMTGRAIRGAVLDAHGKVMPGLAVSAYMEAPASDPLLPTSGVDDTLDDAGRFEIAGLVPGTYRVSAYSDSLLTSQTPLYVELGAGRDTENVQVILPVSGALRGTVVDNRADPVGRLQVMASIDSGEASFGAVTASDGAFIFSHMAPGEYRVHASRPGPTATLRDTAETVTARVVADATTEVRLVVTSARGEIRGRVLHAGGSPVDDAFVTAVHEASEINVRMALRWGGGRPVLTDADGNFTLGDLVEGTHALRAYRRGGGEAVAEHVMPGATTTLTITPTAELAGTLAGELPDEFAIFIVDDRTGVQRLEEFYRTEGRWGFDALPAGSYGLFFESAIGATRQTITLRPDERRIDLRVALSPPGRITGRVVEANTLAPISGVRVQASPTTSRTRFINPSDEVVTGADGRFEIPRVAAGPANLSARADDPSRPGGQGADLQIVVEAGRSIDVVVPIASDNGAAP